MNAIVDRWISDHKDEIVKALQESVRIPSVEGTAEAGAPFGANVKRALEHALRLGEGLGFETRDMDGYIGLIDHGEGEETLGIMCHLDVVPEGEGWDHPPYGAEIVDGNIVGRGTMDDKGPAISALCPCRGQGRGTQDAPEGEDNAWMRRGERLGLHESLL